MTIISTFSTHPSIQSSGHQCTVKWLYNLQLKKNIIQLVESKPEHEIDDWARIFILKIRDISDEQNIKNQNSPLESEHLKAYLEKIGEKAGRRVYRQLRKYPKHIQLRYEQAELWQISWSYAAAPQHFFKNFRIFNDSNVSNPVENYARKKMEGKIKDDIFPSSQKEGWSDWRLLRGCSQKDLKEALQRQLGKPNLLQKYWQVWKCFKEVYAPPKSTTISPLPPPTTQQLQEIVELYQTLYKAEILAEEVLTINGSKMKGILPYCIKALRHYSSRIEDSIDRRVGDKSTSFGDLIIDPDSKNTLERIVDRELNNKLKVTIINLLKKLKLKQHNLLLLNFGFGFSNRIIAPIFEIHYSTINRDINKALTELLRDLVIEIIIEFSQDFCWECDEFWQIIEELDSLSKAILVLHYYSQMNEQQIARFLNISEKEVQRQLEKHNQALVNTMIVPNNSILTCDSVWLKERNDDFKEILIDYYQQLSHEEFRTTIKELGIENQNLLGLHYHYEKNEQQIADHLKNISEEEVKEQLENCKQALVNAIKERLTNLLKIPLSSLEHIDEQKCKSLIVMLLR